MYIPLKQGAALSSNYCYIKGTILIYDQREAYVFAFLIALYTVKPVFKAISIKQLHVLKDQFYTSQLRTIMKFTVHTGQWLCLIVFF